MRKIIVLTVLALMTTVAVSNAQRGNRLNANESNYNQRKCMIPDVTDEQEQKIDALRTAHWNEVKSMRADIDILQAELRKLRIADNSDTKGMDAKIDQIGALKTKMFKSTNNHQLQVKNLLTDDQKAWFDMHEGRGGRYSRFGNGNGRRGRNGNKCGMGGNGMNGRGQGYGQGQGYGYGNGMGMRN